MEMLNKCFRKVKKQRFELLVDRCLKHTDHIYLLINSQKYLFPKKLRLVYR